MKHTFNFLMFISLLTISCEHESLNKEESIDDSNSICSECLLGKWELNHGVKIIGNDTDQVFDDGEITTYRYGIREQYKNVSHLYLDIRRDSFLYDELINNNVDTYTENWELLNTTLSKTLLKLKIRFNPSNDVSIFRIEKITNEELNIVHSASWMGVPFYLNYKFKKIDNSQNQSANNEMLTAQSPTTILGTWTLKEYSDIGNDSVFIKYFNDTLLIQQYQYHYSHWSPGYYTKEIHKIPYKLELSFMELGSLKSITNNNSTVINDFGYWYWLDNENIHNQFYIDGSGCLGSYYYRIVKLDDDSLFIKHNTEIKNPIIYKFIKKK